MMSRNWMNSVIAAVLMTAAGVAAAAPVFRSEKAVEAAKSYLAAVKARDAAAFARSVVLPYEQDGDLIGAEDLGAACAKAAKATTQAELSATARCLFEKTLFTDAFPRDLSTHRATFKISVVNAEKLPEGLKEYRKRARALPPGYVLVAVSTVSDESIDVLLGLREVEGKLAVAFAWCARQPDGGE